MTQSLKRLGAGMLVLAFALMVQLTRIQFINADELNAQPGNQRTLLEEYSRARGPIVVDQAPIARSVATDDDLKYVRKYESGPEFAAVTGFYSIVFGATGLEKTENDVLAGTDPRLFVDRMQQLFAGRQVQGGSVTTTVHGAAQQAAWNGMQGKIGAVHAIEPSTGRILAQVQSPSFDPERLSSHDSADINQYYKQLDEDPDKPLLNRPIAKTIPPGSTFKIVTAAAALESGRFTPDSVIPGPQTYTLPGTNVQLPNWDGKACGPNDQVTLRRALEHSCNTAFAWLGNELGDDALREQAERFGFETSFEIPLTAAASHFPDNPDASQTAQSAIGQFDVRATAMQMAMVAAAVGNAGMTMRPWLLDQIGAPDLSALESYSPKEFGRAMSPEHAQELTDMLVSTVTNGTATAGQIPGVAVAGKTGTAETSEDRPSIAWFVSFAPAVNPQVAVAVAVEDAGTNEVSGNGLAGPVARAVMQAVLGG